MSLESTDSISRFDEKFFTQAYVIHSTLRISNVYIANYFYRQYNSRARDAKRFSGLFNRENKTSGTKQGGYLKVRLICNNKRFRFIHAYFQTLYNYRGTKHNMFLFQERRKELVFFFERRSRKGFGVFRFFYNKSNI